MPETKKETPNPKEEEDKTSKNEPEENETPENEDESSDKEKEYKARMEHHQKKQKELEQELEETKKKLPKKEEPSEEDDEIDHIIEVTSATEGLERKEISHLKLVANAKDVSLSEARDDDDFNIWLEAKRKKVERDKQTPEPDSRQPSEEKTYADWTQEDLHNASDDERIKYLDWKKTQKPGSLKF